MKNQNLKATLRLVKKQQEPVLYYEDLLKQKEFSLEDWRKAKRKHPICTWFRSQYVTICDALKEAKYAFTRWCS